MATIRNKETGVYETMTASDFYLLVTREIVWSIKRYNRHAFDETNIYASTRLKQIFPSSSVGDDEDNRLGCALLDAFSMIRNFVGLGKETDIGYGPREEFKQFQTIEDVAKHFRAIVLQAKGDDFIQ